MLFRIQKKKHLKVLFLLYHIVIVEWTIIFFFYRPAQKYDYIGYIFL